MRALLAVGLLCATLAFADETADRTAIERVVTSVSPAQLGRAMQHANEPWSEVTPPLVAVQSIRFLTPEIALVDATSTQFGSTMLTRRVPVWLVMKKEGAAWKIASLKLPAASDFV